MKDKIKGQYKAELNQSLNEINSELDRFHALANDLESCYNSDEVWRLETEKEEILNKIKEEILNKMKVLK